MAKGKAVWWVTKQGDGGVLVLLYRGPDKKAARDRAAKELNADPKASLGVARVSSVTTLNAASLKQSLPKDAF